MMTAQSLFSAKTRATMDRNIAMYPPEQKQSAVMACLIAAQEEHGWVSPEIIAEVAQILEMPKIAVEEVATFYNMFHTKPVGRVTISVCTNLPCALRDGVKAGETVILYPGSGMQDGQPVKARGAT